MNDCRRTVEFSLYDFYWGLGFTDGISSSRKSMIKSTGYHFNSLHSEHEDSQLKTYRARAIIVLRITVLWIMWLGKRRSRMLVSMPSGDAARPVLWRSDAEKKYNGMRGSEANQPPVLAEIIQFTTCWRNSLHSRMPIFQIICTESNYAHH